MKIIEEIAFIGLAALILAILVILIMWSFGIVEPVTWRAAGASGVQSESAHFPVIYSGYLATPTMAPVPSATPTSKPSPTPTVTPTPEPGALWTWVARAGNVGETTVIYAVIPGYCCELVGLKSSKTIYVRAECPAEPTCEIFPPPEVIPPPFAWGDVEKLIYDANSQDVCSVQWPFNCVATR